MKIFMYNTWFGDCFKVENGNSNLVVDFGIHAQSEVKPSKIGCNVGTRDEVHEFIANEFISFDVNHNLLITHFHEDHISGLVYMYNERNNVLQYTNVFNKVYIPDIWGIPESSKVVAIHLLEELLKSTKLNKRKGSITLLELVKFLCVSTKKVEFIHRGSIFEDNKYIALWPDVDAVGKISDSLINEIRLNSYLYDSLINNSIQLCDIVLNLNNNETNDNENYLRRLEIIEESLINLTEDDSLKTLANEIKDFEDNDTESADPDIKKSPITYLNSFKNKISIVFHNIENDALNNVLFTGDIESKYLSDIATNYDGKSNCFMHDSYTYIKVPHHGTFGGKSDQHYFDFQCYSPSVLMIPNGECKNKPSHKICKEYSNLSHGATPARMYCSNCNWCAINPGMIYNTCVCSSHDLVFPYMIRTIIP